MDDPELEGAEAASQSAAWQAIATAVGDVDAGSASATMSKLLERRDLLRRAEDQRIQASMVELETALARTCSAAAGPSSAFAQLQVREAASLTSDRQLITALLEAAGPEGRKRIWESADGVGLLLAPWETTLAAGFQALPAWVGQGTDSATQTDAQRRLLATNLANERAVMEARAALTTVEAGLLDLDPMAADTPRAAAALLGTADNALLAQQKASFGDLLTVCGDFPPEQWLMLLSGDYISGFVGELGGYDEPARQSGVFGSMSGPGGMQGGMGGGMQGGMGGGMQGGFPMGGGQGGGMPGGMQGGGMQGGGMQGGGMQGGGMQQGGGQPGGGMQSGGSPGGIGGGPAGASSSRN